MHRLFVFVLTTVLFGMASVYSKEEPPDVAQLRAILKTAKERFEKADSANKTLTPRIYVLNSGERIPVKSAIKSNGQITLMLPGGDSQTVQEVDIEKIEETPVDRTEYNAARSAYNEIKAKVDAIDAKESKLKASREENLKFLKQYAGTVFRRFAGNNDGSADEWRCPPTQELERMSDTDLAGGVEKIHHYTALNDSDERLRAAKERFKRSMEGRAPSRTGD